MSAAIHSLFCCTPKTTLECIPQNKTSVTVFDHYLKKKKKKDIFVRNDTDDSNNLSTKEELL